MDQKFNLKNNSKPLFDIIRLLLPNSTDESIIKSLDEIYSAIPDINLEAAQMDLINAGLIIKKKYQQSFDKYGVRIDQENNLIRQGVIAFLLRILNDPKMDNKQKLFVIDFITQVHENQVEIQGTANAPESIDISEFLSRQKEKWSLVENVSQDEWLFDVEKIQKLDNYLYGTLISTDSTITPLFSTGFFKKKSYANWIGQQQVLIYMIHVIAGRTYAFANQSIYKFASERFKINENTVSALKLNNSLRILLNEKLDTRPDQYPRSIVQINEILRLSGIM